MATSTEQKLLEALKAANHALDQAHNVIQAQRRLIGTLAKHVDQAQLPIEVAATLHACQVH